MSTNRASPNLILPESKKSVGCKRVLRYLHVPKAGSAFAPYIWAATCASLPRDVLILRPTPTNERSTDLLWRFDWSEACPCVANAHNEFHHAHLGENASDGRVAEAAGLFRAPLDRDISHWNYFRPMRRPREKDRLQLTLKLLQNLSTSGSQGFELPPPQPPLNTSEYLQMVAYLASQRHQHIQSRITYSYSGMDVQRLFAEPRPRDDRALRILTGRVWRMGFVGLTECFEESVEVFVRKFELNRTRMPLQSQHQLVRANAPSPSSELGAIVHAQAESLRRLGWTDPYDEAVYDAARARFHQERRAYHVPVMSKRCNATTVPAENRRERARAHQPWLNLVKLVNADSLSEYDSSLWKYFRDF